MHVSTIKLISDTLEYLVECVAIASIRLAKS